jgi:hypothetical protein
LVGRVAPRAPFLLQWQRRARTRLRQGYGGRGDAPYQQTHFAGRFYPALESAGTCCYSEIHFGNHYRTIILVRTFYSKTFGSLHNRLVLNPIEQTD